ncbi:MAG: Maf family protein [Gammaproteobacteria bacterium]
MTDHQPALTLASTSPYRKALLERLGLSFETIRPEVDETPEKHESAEALVARLSELKARAGANSHSESWVIGSDQVAVCKQQILGKPGNNENAIRQLKSLSGNRVTFLTGLCLHNAAAGISHSTLVPFSVVFRELTNEEIERYLLADEPYNCAGSFKSEGLGISLFERMEGEDPSALMGLPLIQLVTWLRLEGFTIP